MKKLLSRLLIIVVLVFVCFFTNQYLERRNVEEEQVALVETGSGSTANDRRSYDPPVDENHPTLLWFARTYENREAFLGFADDLTDDGLEDLIILFHEDGRTDICWMCVAVQQGDGGWIVTDPVRAPVENQKIRIFDMDHESPLEYIITGEKDGNIGYAIYRIMDGKLTDLFGEDMKDCC